MGLPQIYGRNSKVTLPGVTKPVATTWTSLLATSELYPDLVVPFQDNVAVETISASRHSRTCTTRSALTHTWSY